ncbi:hypothetical protein [Nocardioides sp.]|uniref:hypothetical protein n=1 Tax=Nocardioides sp. TaxID=35761 RepID=UPI0027183B2E|nr:hypothetical protein [Nocardioides sp.]MDO9458386.1 hypothetical protein [Nocardioides sp.]
MSRLLRPVVAALVAAAGCAALAVLVGAAAPAQAAACSTASGVTVVADFNGLGGGVQGACVADGGGDKASDLFPAAGFPLNLQTPGSPGYVCQVSGKPNGCGRPDGDAYWGLWWSDGRTGRWTYASLGAASLRVPDGGYVAFAWDDAAGEVQPSYTPAAHAAPSPTPQPTQPTQQPPPQPTQAPTRTPSASPAPSGTSTSAAPGAPTTTPTATTETPSTSAPTTASGTPTAPTSTATTTAPAEGTPTATDNGTETGSGTGLADPVAPTAADTDDDGGLPGWLAPLVIVLLFGVAGAVVLLKRRRPTP